MNLWGWIRRWIARLALVLVATAALAYVGDCAVYRLRHSPQGQVTVTNMLVVPLKGQKADYEYLGTQDMACPVALFPQGGVTPCWYLRRHPNLSQSP